MIAKIIAKEENRKKSIEKMIDFLTKIKIEGIHTNQSFLLKVLQNEHFVNATYNTKFIENNLNLILQKKGSIGSLEINEEATKKLRQEKNNKTPQVVINTNEQKEPKIKIKNVPGKIYENPKFLPGGDKYMLIEFEGWTHELTL